MDVYAELSMDDILELPNDDYFYDDSSSSSLTTTTTCFDPSYYYPNLNDLLSVPGGDMEDLGWLSSSVDQSYTNTSLPTTTNQLTTTTATTTNNNNNNNNNTPRRCTHCASEKTPQWRTGPLGPKTLCNACGVRYKSGRLVPEYRPASSPTFVLSQHSNSHRKVMELRRQKQEMFLTNKGHQQGHERHFSLC